MSKIQKLLLDKINENESLINDWFEQEFSHTKPLFYNSVDLRHSGFKIAPVDNNCFPAGFNNLGEGSRKIAKKIASEFFSKNYPDVKKVLLIPENHTRNIKYLENVLALKNIIENDGKIEVVMGSLIPDLEGELIIGLEFGHRIVLNELVKTGNKVITKSGFEANVIITNNDFTNEPGEILKNIAQDVIPSPTLGWFERTKSNHFSIYEKLANQLSDQIKIDPWLITPIHKSCKDVDFKNSTNIDKLADLVAEVLSQTKTKYEQYGINEDPYCYVKADSGTYGMAMMTIKDADEIRSLNKKQRNKMNMIKGNIVNNRVIIQEGIPTIDTINDIIAEPMIYLIAGNVVGNLARVNGNRDKNISLNSAGMEFKDILDVNSKDLNIGSNKEEIFKIYNLIGKLSALVAAQE
jgi:glutamate--cysteine ligase